MSCEYSTDSSQYENQLDAFKVSYSCNLKSFKEYYILTKQFPEDDTYAKGYQSAKSNLVELSRNLFLLNNMIQKDIDSLQVDSGANTSEINTHKGIRSGLEDELTFIEGEVGGAKQMAEDYKIRYTQQYLLNWSMFIGIVLSSATLFYTFRNVEK